MRGPEFGPRAEDWSEMTKLIPNMPEAEEPAVYENDQAQGTIFNSAETPPPTLGSIPLPRERKYLSGRELNEALSCADFDVWNFGRDSLPGQ